MAAHDDVPVVFRSRDDVAMAEIQDELEEAGGLHGNQSVGSSAV
ncbi:MAG: hypothetical protein AB1511_03300 [Deinococcota bacterium]